MKQQTVFALMAALALGTVAMAQPRTIRATMTGGGGGDGKCTFEVEVDGAAEVEIHGDTGVDPAVERAEGGVAAVGLQSAVTEQSGGFPVSGD